MMKFATFSANENQSRLINAAISGTVFLNSDDLASSAGQSLARMCLTNARIVEIACSGVTFRPVEGNTGTNATDVFVRQEGSTWYVAVFNYSSAVANKTLNLSRLGISGSYLAWDLWSGATSAVSGTTWNVSLGSRQAKLFQLGFGITTATGPTNQPLIVGSATTLSATASGSPPFTYTWMKNGSVLPGQDENSVTLNPVAQSDAGAYSVIVAGANGSVTNSAVLTTTNLPTLTGQIDNGTLMLSWPADHTGWRLQSQIGALNTNWFSVAGSTDTNRWIPLISSTTEAEFFRLVYP
jgi:hypothetical protein